LPLKPGEKCGKEAFYLIPPNYLNSQVKPVLRCGVNFIFFRIKSDGGYSNIFAEG